MMMMMMMMVLIRNTKDDHGRDILVTGTHKMISKLATQSFHILRLIARNRNFSLPYFNVSRLSGQSRLHEIIYMFSGIQAYSCLYIGIFSYIWAYMPIAYEYGNLKV